MKNLLFIHGAGNQGNVWKYTVKYLKGNYNINTPDLPGHGKEKGLCKTIDEYAEWILGYIDNSKLSDVILIGHSMGGAITIKAAKDKRIAAVIIVGSGLKLPVNPKIINGLKNDIQNTIETVAKWSFSKEAPKDMVKSAVKMMLDNKDIILNDFEACSKYSGYDVAQTIEKPSVVMVGDKDVMTPFELAKEASDYLQTKVEIINNAGHMVQFENSKTLAEKIGSFVSLL